jgi:hypothetical protein
LEHRVKPGRIRDTLIDRSPRPERTQAAVHTALAPGFITENYKHRPAGQGFFWGHLYVLVMVEVRGFEPLTPCVQRRCYPVSERIFISAKGQSHACNVSQRLRFSLPVGKNWYSKPRSNRAREGLKTLNQSQKSFNPRSLTG